MCEWADGEDEVDQQDNRIVLHDCLEEIYIHVRSKTTGVKGLGKTI